MFKLFLIFLLVFPSAIIHLPSAMCQQLPYYTQFRPNSTFLNPGVIGTKRMVDARLNYHRQWVGFTDAPVTQGISLNGRLLRGTTGLGASFFNDHTGPTKRSNVSFAYSFHAKFDDVELSIGAAYDMLTYHVDGTKLNLHIPYDNTINLAVAQKKRVSNASAGAYLYNDRFHVGLSLLNLLEPKINFYDKGDTTHRTRIHMVPHYYGSVGYNWSGQPDWIWENSFQMVYAQGNPMTIDYSLRLHYLQQVFGGISIRPRDAFVLHAGVTLMEKLQISYSYDIIVSSLRSFQSGSHEIMLVWSQDVYKKKKLGRDTARFKRQRYSYMF